MLYAVLSIKAVAGQEKLCKQGFIPRPRGRTRPHPRHQTAWGAIRPRHQHHLHPPPRVPMHPWRLLGVIDAIRAMDGRKQQVPSSGVVIELRTEVLVLNTSQYVKGLVKNLSVLEATRGSFVRKKEPRRT